MNNDDMFFIIFILILVIFFKKSCNNTEHFSNNDIKKDHIFVSIASYRDSECPMTIKSLFSQAENPDRIHIGLCQQNKDDDVDCYDNSERKDQIKIKKYKHLQAKGPTYARYICSTLWDGEEYYLQIDSHMDFEKNWDTTAINLLNNCKKLSPKPVLTHYPPSKTDKSGLLSYMCNSSFNSNNIPTFTSGLISHREDNLQSPFTAAGLLFLESHFLEACPFDPYLPYLFQGEEILFSARLWTNGYDFYLPLKNLCKHSYTRSDSPKFWTDVKDWSKTQNESLKRAKYILKWIDEKELNEESKKELEKYGLGKERSIEDYFKFAGIDYKNKKGTNYCSKKYVIKDNKWIPM